MDSVIMSMDSVIISMDSVQLMSMCSVIISKDSYPQHEMVRVYDNDTRLIKTATDLNPLNNRFCF